MQVLRGMVVSQQKQGKKEEVTLRESHLGFDVIQDIQLQSP